MKAKLYTIFALVKEIDIYGKEPNIYYKGKQKKKHGWEEYAHCYI